MSDMSNSLAILSDAQIEQFIDQGFVRIDNAFPKQLATRARARMWRDIDADPKDPATWTAPVIRLWVYWQKPFREAANTPVLHGAFDQLVGKGRWLPREALGTFVVRFPSQDAPGDTGWHVDASFPPPEFQDEPELATDFHQWRINVRSRDRALLMLFLLANTTLRHASGPGRIGTSRGCSNRTASKDLPEISTSAFATGDRRFWRPDLPARSTSVIRSWFMRLSHIEARCRVSSLNRNCSLPNPSRSIGRTVITLRWRPQSAGR